MPLDPISLSCPNIIQLTTSETKANGLNHVDSETDVLHITKTPSIKTFIVSYATIGRTPNIANHVFWQKIIGD